jgi:Ca-activated chloride channel family protein
MKRCCIVDKNMKRVDCQLQNVEVVANIDGMIAEVTIYQVYQNLSNATIDALYTFPLLNESKVTGFVANAGKTKIEGEFRNKDEAYREYDKAVRKGNNSYLLENFNEDIFQISIGNIPANEKVVIAITYIEEIKIKDNEINWKVPTLVTPKYMNDSKEEAENEIDYWNNYYFNNEDDDYVKDNSLYKLKLTANIKGLRHIKVIESPSHQISISAGRDFYVVKLSKHSVFLENDFSLLIKLEKIETNYLNMAITEENEVFAEANFNFEMDRQIVKKNEYIFLLDVSETMYGNKFEDAKRVLECSLRNLEMGDYFDIIAFDNTYKILSRTSLSFNSNSYCKAEKWMNNLVLNGEKELYDIMHYLLEGVEPKSEFGKVIILITDGKIVEGENEIIEMIKSYDNLVKIFTFGINAMENKNFIDGIAKASNGSAEYIFPGESIEYKVGKQFMKISQPIAKFKKVVDNFGDKIPILPDLPEYLNLSNAYRFYIRASMSEYIERLSNISVCVEIDGEDFELQLFKTGKGNARLLTVKWVKERIKQLEEALYKAESIKDAKIKKEIAYLSIKYRVFSSETSLVGICNKINEENETLDRYVIPVTKPTGWRILNNDHMFDSALNNRFELKDSRIKYDSQLVYVDDKKTEGYTKTVEEFNDNKKKNSIGKIINFFNKSIKSFIYSDDDEDYYVTQELDNVYYIDKKKNKKQSKKNKKSNKRKDNILKKQLNETDGSECRESIYDNILNMIEKVLSEQNIDGSFGNVQNSNYKTSCFIIAMLLLNDETTLKFSDEITHAGSSLLTEVDNDILFKTIALDMIVERGMLNEADMFPTKSNDSFKYIGDYIEEMKNKLNIIERQSYKEFRQQAKNDVYSLIKSFLKVVLE